MSNPNVTSPDFCATLYIDSNQKVILLMWALLPITFQFEVNAYIWYFCNESVTAAKF